MVDLREEKVTVKQFRRNGWLPEGHDGALRYTRCAVELLPQVDSTGYPVTGLNEETEKFFEDKLSLSTGTLSRYNQDYWSKYRIKIGKEGLFLDLNNPKDLLTYELLKVHNKIANSEAEKRDSPFAEFVLTSKTQEAKADAVTVKEKRNAYKLFGAMTAKEMAGFLKVYGKRPSDTGADFLEAEIGKIIENNPKEFVTIMEDPALLTKVFIDDCLAAGALVKSGSKYMLKGGDIIGYSLDETIVYLKAPENQEVLISLKSKVKV